MAPQTPARKTPKPKQNAPLFVANPQQAAAIAHTDGPAAFIAAAGTGKTAILVQRLVRLIAEERIAPEVILCVTFTRAAAEEMKKRALHALKAHGKPAKDLKGLHVATFHGLGHQMLREKLGLAPQQLNQQILSGDPRQWLAEDILRNRRSSGARGLNWDVPVADALVMVDRAKEALISPEASADYFREEFILTDDLPRRFQDFFVEYEATKKKQKLYDLSDLIYIPLRLLEGSPAYRKQWQGRFHYLQVDETQDTNPSQYSLIQHLAAPKNNVVVVGDPDQAIYNFRGASPEASILSFKRMYPKGTIYRIEHNYRSTPQILEAANALISHNPNTPGFEKILRPTQPDGLPVVVTAYEDQEREAEGIAQRIATLVRDASERHENLTYRNIFVLSRTNHHLASLEIVLARNQIPYRALGGSSFFKRKTTRDMLAFLALVDGMRLHHEFLAAQQGAMPPRREDVFSAIVTGEQNAAFRAVAHIPSQAFAARTGKASHRFTPALYAMISAASSGQPLLQFCAEHTYAVPPEHQLAMKDFVGLIRTVAETCHNRPDQAIKQLRMLAYDAHLRHRDTRHSDEADDETEAPRAADETRVEGRFDELEELLHIAARHHTIRHFLQAMAQLKEQAEDNSKNKRDCVALLTVHKSKGLEQKVVFVMGMVEGIFPHKRSYAPTEDDGPALSGIPEERRLAYVACTRARQQLYLSTLLRYRGADATPSRFIHEAGLSPTTEAGILNPFLMRAAEPSRKRKTRAPAPPTLFDALGEGGDAGEE